MPDPAAMALAAAAAHGTAIEGAVQCDLINARSVVRLKRALPMSSNGEHAVQLDGQALPAMTGTTLSAEPRVLCLAPGEWLIVSTVLSGPRLHQELKSCIPGHDFALVDLSHALTIVRIAGAAARELLSKGCGLDLHARSFPAGRCAQTRFAQIPLLIDCVDPQPCVELYVGRSYVAYLQAWLKRASAEYYEALA